YKKICEVTGINNLQVADKATSTNTNTQVDTSRTITLEFDANTRNELPWEFRPVESSIKVHPGQLVQIAYEVHNRSEQMVSGQAIPSYGPRLAERYFRKLDCFCFAKQDLRAGETRQMPVVFVIQPDLPDDVNTITLSYTFFRIEGPTMPSAARVPAAGSTGPES
ncbi:MAG: cytochrome c oxidase assembly protein, partial [Burkholderiales bacterium]|nr:cytochrome c oxidase assembly protein [Burkholderiales bacterium]